MRREDSPHSWRSTSHQGERPPSPAQLAQLHAALDRPDGFASYGAVQQWIADTLGVPMGYHAVYKLVRRKLRAKLKVPRPQHEKNDQAVAQFQAEFPALVQAAVAPDEPRPVVVWAFDQSRFGLRTIQRRRITSCGVKPRGICQYGYQNFWLYGAVAPATGDAFFYVLPMLNAEYMQLFLNALAEARPDTLNVLLLDNSRAHRAQTWLCRRTSCCSFSPRMRPRSTPVNGCGRTSKPTSPGSATHRSKHSKTTSCGWSRRMMRPPSIP